MPMHPFYYWSRTGLLLNAMLELYALQSTVTVLLLHSLT